MKKGLVAVALALLVFTPWSAVSTAETFSTTFEVPPFNVGDVASYATAAHPLNITVHALVQTLNRSGQFTQAAPFSYESDGQASLLNVSTQTLRAENWAEYCPLVNWNGSGCQPWIKLRWDYQGLPVAFGASVLQGRALALGDEWTIQGDCEACALPMQVRIEPPRTGSPLGTAFVVNLTLAAKPTIESEWLLSGELLHMGTAHAFPLLVEAANGATYTLASFEAGSLPIPNEDLVDPAYSPPLSGVVQSFQGGRPVEGAPLQGHPSWADARKLTGADAADSTPGAFFKYASYWVATSFPFGEGWVTVGDTSVYTPPEADEPVWESYFSRPGQPDVRTEYEAFRPVPNVTRELPSQSAWLWKKTTEERPATAIGTCSRSSVPLWDGVRYLLNLPQPFVENTFEGLSIYSSCAQTLIEVNGPAHGHSAGPIRLAALSSVRMDATTGYLVEAFYWPEGVPG